MRPAHRVDVNQRQVTVSARGVSKKRNDQKRDTAAIRNIRYRRTEVRVRGSTRASEGERAIARFIRGERPAGVTGRFIHP